MPPQTSMPGSTPRPHRRKHRFMATRKKSAAAAPSRPAARSSRRLPAADGRQLVIVESPAKAKTINRYLGPGFMVQASVGHIRDLPAKAEKGSKDPLPGVDLETFEPTYEISPAKAKTVAALRKACREASEVWFATDLDREGEAIAWHLAEVLGIDPRTAKRVIFNAITKEEIKRAFEHPHPINLDKVNAQQARRILDRIVGYQVSNLLWKKVAGKLSAGRVQSVAVRLVVEREQEIAAFVPDESWRFTARLASPEQSPSLAAPFAALLAKVDERGRGVSVRDRLQWLADHAAIEAELVELDGQPFSLTCTKDAVRDLSADAARVAERVGLRDLRVERRTNPGGKGPAEQVTAISGELDPAARYAVESIESKPTSGRTPPPFITSTLQMSASSELSFGTDRTMRIAQQLYQGVKVAGEGEVGLITYMRTDSTHLAPEAIAAARDFIGEAFGAKYLPDKPRAFASSNKAAQEAHEAIRPTDVRRTPDSVRDSLTEEQFRLYRLIWSRFLACQMNPPQYRSTTMRLARTDRPGAVLKATGRVLVFDGSLRVGVGVAGDEPELPALREGDALSPFSIAPEQLFSSPPPRYSEASLVKKLEEEGIGRPSTYASIMKTIVDRKYGELVDRRFHATDLGIKVTDKLIEGFPELMDLGYTRQMESELDAVEEQHRDWKQMLRAFYGPFRVALEHAAEKMTHARAEIEPAPFACPLCSRRTEYRFGKNGRFLSCSGYPECRYAAPVDRQGQPLLEERVDLACPEDGSQMILRTGRFGKFLASENYPKVKFVLNLDKKGNLKFPAVPPLATDLPCPKCGAPLNLREGKRGPWLGCSKFPKCRGREAWAKIDEATRSSLGAALEQHLAKHPPIVVTRLDGTPLPEGTPLTAILLPGAVQTLEIHPDAVPAKAG
jgi:DNA topoisomerase-1